MPSTQTVRSAAALPPAQLGSSFPVARGAGRHATGWVPSPWGLISGLRESARSLAGLDAPSSQPQPRLGVLVPGDALATCRSHTRTEGVAAAVVRAVGRVLSVSIALAGLLGIGWSAYRQPTFQSLRDEAARTARALRPGSDGLWLRPVAGDRRPDLPAPLVPPARASLGVAPEPSAWELAPAVPAPPSAVLSSGGRKALPPRQRRATRQVRKPASPLGLSGAAVARSSARAAPQAGRSPKPSAHTRGRAPLRKRPREATSRQPARPGRSAARGRPASKASQRHLARPLALDLNRAVASELTQLPGIGPKRAQAIVALRSRVGRFRRVADLLRVRGIGVRTLQRIRPHLVVNP